MRLNPLRNVATAACVVAMLLPYLVGVGIARGLADQVADSASSGADLYVAGVDAGIAAPVPLFAWGPVRAVDGVVSVTPRIIAPIQLGARDEPAVLVGLPHWALPASRDVVRGRMIAAEANHEVVIGSVLAKALGLDVGSAIPPFYRSRRGERVTTVVGVFTPDAPTWQARMMLTCFETAAQIVDREDAATDLLVACADSDTEAVARRIRNLPLNYEDGRPLRLRVTTRTDVSVLGLRDVLHAEGIYHALFALVFAAGIPIVLVTSGIGLRERRRETGLLRATGWRADEVLLRSIVENVVVATIAGGAAVALAWVWLVALGGWGIAPLFFQGTGADAGFRVPFRLAPLPLLLGFGLSYVLVLVGSVPATWRAASAPPARSME